MEVTIATVPGGTRSARSGWDDHRPRSGFQQRRQVTAIIEETDMVRGGGLQRCYAMQQQPGRIRRIVPACRIRYYP